MNTKTSNWMRRLAGIAALLMIFMSNAGLASARILFQDDTVGVWESDQIQIGSNDAGAANTSVQFGSDVTPAENGVINWNITTNTFELDHTAAITGGLSATGAVNFSGSTGFRAREVAGITNPGTACTTAGELIVDTVTNILYICTNAGTDAWQAAGSGTNAATLDGLDSLEFLRANASDTFGDGGALTLTIGSDDTLTVDGTLDANGVVTIGDNGDTVTIDSSSWDVTGAGVGSGFTGFTSTGAINFNGASSFGMPTVAGPANPATCTEGDLVYNLTDNITYICTATDTWTGLSSGGVPTFETIYAGDTNLTTSDGLFTITTGTNDFVVDSNDWNVTAAGALDAATITSNGLLTGTLGATISGATINLNDGSNFATNIGTGGSTGAVSIGGGSNTVAVNSTTWDISTTGAASGFTTIDASGNITTSGGTFIVGTTALNETTSAVDSGAFLVGAFDEFANSNSTTVQGVLNDLDALIGAGAPNVNELTFYPEYPDVVVYRDTTANSGTLVSDYDSANRRQYYGWTSTKVALNDIDLRFRYELPADWLATGDLTLQLRTLTTAAADNAVDLVLRNETDNVTCATSAGNVSSVANTWETVTVTAATINAGCAGANTLAAGDIIEIIVKPYAKSTGATDVGRVMLDYTN